MSLTDSGISDIAAGWDRYAAAYQSRFQLPTDVVSYGPGVGTEAEFRLLSGPLTGKRVLDLGCGGGQTAIALAKQGAIAIGIDISAEQLAFARRLVEQEDVRVELRQGDLAELAFQRADSVDLVFSAFALQFASDLNRVFRQVHRVLKPQASLVFSIPHPTSTLFQPPAVEGRPPAQLVLDTETSVRRSYFDRSPLAEAFGDVVIPEYHRTISDIFIGLTRSSYRVDAMLEPETSRSSLWPKALIIRARKEA